MDLSEATKVVFKRIAELNPQNAAKVVGYVLLQEQGAHEMIRLAKAPNHILKILIDEVGVGESILSCITPTIGKKLSSFPESNHSSYTDKGKNPMEFTPSVTTSSSSDTEKGKNQVLSFDGPSYPSHSPSSCPNIPHELVPKQACDDFSRGYCKNGGNCKLLHLYRMENGCFMVLNPPNTNDNNAPHRNLQRGSLKHLEMELVELLRGRRGIPVSISSVPILYFDKYATSLHVEGHLLENRNEGEFFCRMKEILDQMGNTITMVNRPHGRPSIVLNEDLNDDLNKRNDGIQYGLELRVYMTFRPESVFTEQDAHNYFENFGPVQEVKIPHQVQRMFGFVTFVYPETAALVLTKTNPHNILGSQVKVKPYRLKPMLV